jgi:hypothetical protein
MTDNQWVIARLAHYVHEAQAMRARLADAAIDVQLPEEAEALRRGSLGAPGGLRVMVRPADLERAVNILATIGTPTPVDRAPHPGPLRVYQEWAEHRYDPGHYLGGTIEPDLRIGELGPRARRRSAMLVALSVVSGLVMYLVLPFPHGWSDVPSLAMFGLMGAAAYRLATR